MAEYQKIQTLFKRDEKNIIIPDQFTYPEFEVLKDLKWECTEKIDGTNIRIELVSSEILKKALLCLLKEGQIKLIFLSIF